MENEYFKRDIYRSIKTLLADGTITQEEFDTTKKVLQLANVNDRLDTMVQINEFSGRFFSEGWVKENALLLGVEK